MGSNRFNTQRFGLDKRETFLLISTLKGIGLFEKQIPTAEWLSQIIFEACAESHADLEEMGIDLSVGEKSPELPYEYSDLYEKTKTLKD